MLQDSALLLTKEDIKVLQIALDRYIFSYIDFENTSGIEEETITFEGIRNNLLTKLNNILDEN